MSDRYSEMCRFFYQCRGGHQFKKLQADLDECRKNLARWERIARQKNRSGCCCTFDEAGEKLDGPMCMAHAEYYKDLKAQLAAKDKILKEVFVTMKHARTFIMSRQKMHPTGIKLYDELAVNLKQSLEEHDNEKV